MKITLQITVLVVLGFGLPSLHGFEPVAVNHPGRTCDLGVGLWAWPMPMDWDRDGDLDLIVSCPDKPYNGVYFFENTGSDPKLPIFQAAIRIGDGIRNPQVSYVDGQPRMLVPGKEYVDFLGKDFSQTRALHAPKIQVGDGRVRANQWRMVDFDDDGLLDLVHGAGYWGDYGWDNAFDDEGTWTRGPLHGYVYIMRNRGTDNAPRYEEPYRLQADGKDVDVYGMPSPNFADYDGDGDLDLICGEFLDGFTYFRNVGSRGEPDYAAGVYLTNAGQKVAMHVQMITPTAVDWDGDGDVDLVCGDEDGRVALVENTGKLDDGVPVFQQPAYFQQVADALKFGALVTPFSVDWDNDGDEDLICGNTSGNIGLIENLDGGNPPRWANPVLLEAGGKTIHLQAGPNGSIQGPCEAKWGYTVLNVADWNHDGLHDLIVNSIWGKIVWFENKGSKSKPELEAARAVQVAWKGNENANEKPPKPAWNWWDPAPTELATQWRTTPCVVDWNQDGLNDLVMLDHEGYLAFYQRQRVRGKLVLLPGQRVFRGGVFDNKQTRGDASSESLLRLNSGEAGKSGRRKLCLADWDGDGDLDLLVNSVNINLLRNAGTVDGVTYFEDEGPLGDRKLAGHTTCPTVVDWNRDGMPDLLAGAEDGHFYFLPNPGVPGP
jgi:hypothetical protein